MATEHRRRGSGNTEEWRRSFRMGADSMAKQFAHVWDGDDGYAEQAGPTPFGYQVMVDLYGCNESTLCDINRVVAFLEMLVGELGMQKQAPPFVFLSPPEFLDKQGISGWVPLIESGIQIHTLVQRRFVSLDVYCCRKFNADTVDTIARTTFGAQVSDVAEVERGVRYRWNE